MTSFKASKQETVNCRNPPLGACKTCRERSVDCDRTKPICKACSDSDMICDSRTVEIQWVGPSTSVHYGTAETNLGPNVRRHLYTEKERETMSSALVSGLASCSIDDILTKIDAHSRDLREQHSSNISMGPFGVLNFSGKTDAKIDDSMETWPTMTTALDIPEALPEITTGPSTSGPFTEVSTAEEMLENLDDCLQWADIFNPDPAPIGLMPTPLASGNIGANLLNWMHPEITVQHDPPSLGCNFRNSKTLSEAARLLRHFREHVVARIIWLPMTQKSPWTIMNIPFAMVTLDQLTYMKQTAVKHASLANLYGILACASYHLVLNPGYTPDKPSEFWEGITALAYAEAKKHMKRTFEFEFEGPRKAKYKEQLMAILSLTTFAILSNDQKEARYHIINMEYLIRLRGLVKPQLSRRIRLLHYMYTWIRILTESTFLLHNETSHSAPEQTLSSRHLNMEEMNILAQRRSFLSPGDQTQWLDDFLRVTAAESDSDLSINDLKDTQANLGDIHLVDSRSFPDELHSVVNGVSETWLGLLSQTTRLANIMDRLDCGSCVVALEQRLALHRRILYLENKICAFTSRALPTSNGEPNAHMLKALNSALVIYFYRRVRQLNPFVLQGFVTQVIEELQKWEEALAQHKLIGPGTAWPAFMAGCEAIKQTEQHSILQWLDRAGARSGFISYSAARAIMEEVWKQRDSEPDLVTVPVAQPGGLMAFTWMDLSRQNTQWLILC